MQLRSHRVHSLSLNDFNWCLILITNSSLGLRLSLSASGAAVSFSYGDLGSSGIGSATGSLNSGEGGSSSFLSRRGSKKFFSSPSEICWSASRSTRLRIQLSVIYSGVCPFAHKNSSNPRRSTVLVWPEYRSISVKRAETSKSASSTSFSFDSSTSLWREISASRSSTSSLSMSGEIYVAL